VTDWKTAMIRFPRRVLYERYGLYKMPTVAGWKKAHAAT
jgi:RNA-directed DNA polymerase